MAASLLRILQTIPEHRRAEGKQFGLATVLLFVIVDMVAGANSYRQMHEFIRVHGQPLNEAFGQSLRYAPSYPGLRGILRGVNASAQEASASAAATASVKGVWSISAITAPASQLRHHGSAAYERSGYLRRDQGDVAVEISFAGIGEEHRGRLVCRHNRENRSDDADDDVSLNKREQPTLRYERLQLCSEGSHAE